MRGQSALEFLMTYGWAFLLILVMIGAVVYFGVTDSDNFVPETCTVSQEFTCEDFRLLNDCVGNTCPGSEVSFVLRNNLNAPVDLQRVYITYDEVTHGIDNADTWCGRFGYPSPATLTHSLAPGEEIEVVCNPGDTGNVRAPDGEKARVTFEFKYTKVAGGFNHTAQGEIVANVQ